MCCATFSNRVSRRRIPTVRVAVAIDRSCCCYVTKWTRRRCSPANLSNKLTNAIDNASDVGLTQIQMQRQPQQSIRDRLSNRMLSGAPAEHTTHVREMERLIVKYAVDLM